MENPYDPNESHVKINTSMHHKDKIFNIQVTALSLHDLTARQADTYLKGLIAQALKTAVMEYYGDIQKLVDEVIFSHGMREKVEAVILEEVRKKAAEHVKDMFG